MNVMGLYLALETAFVGYDDFLELSLGLMYRSPNWRWSGESVVSLAFMALIRSSLSSLRAL